MLSETHDEISSLDLPEFTKAAEGKGKDMVREKVRPSLSEYITRKKRDLSDREKREIRVEIERGNGNVYMLAERFNCVPTQVAGIKARMKF